ncbi:NAD(P)H-quinone oxidoreductase [Mangrovivirga sp. M17]|uniref:NAD(P)H-quinone oxidoreductase n=1 Tax=Mangrovivirga halotolerans TaxID=2993936 RepID=A0ABT3RP06_9BACT|nr:NAD(P)H-quinone oxidoreductase [Mangrovivirga halotolerans]MCX2743534.1 NAD(P)H-quinone oxidoreductase [Mangrovivirga halotolerans]
MKHIIYNENGDLESMDWQSGESLKPKAGQLKIEVKAFSLNRADLLQRKGKYPPPPGESKILGLECAGVVIEKGDDCENFNIGDKVMCLLAGGGYATEVVVNEDLCMNIPNQMDFASAAAIPESFLTAFQCLHTIAKIKSGDKVLIHAGGSGLGTAAIQLCKIFSAESIVTAGTEEKINFCKTLGASLGINYKNESFKEIIEENYGKNKIDIIMDVIGKPYVDDNIDVLKSDGRWLLIAFMGGARAENFPLFKLLAKRIQLTGTTLRARSLNYKARLINDFSKLALPAFTEGKIKPVIHDIYNYKNIIEATRTMENNQNIGKLVISFD